MSITSDRLQSLLQKYREQKASTISVTKVEESTKNIKTVEQELDPESYQVIDRYGKLITLNDKQIEFVKLAGEQGKSAVLIGAAGCGKTTTQYAVTQTLVQSGQAGLLQSDGHKHLLSDSPGIVICAYTRRAVANIRRNLPKDLQANAITIHKLLEYSPVYDSVLDPETGEEKTKMSFRPARHAGNPLPSSIRTLIFEEASMLGDRKIYV